METNIPARAKMCQIDEEWQYEDRNCTCPQPATSPGLLHLKSVFTLLLLLVSFQILCMIFQGQKNDQDAENVGVGVLTDQKRFLCSMGIELHSWSIPWLKGKEKKVDPCA